MFNTYLRRNVQNIFDSTTRSDNQFPFRNLFSDHDQWKHKIKTFFSSAERERLHVASCLPTPLHGVENETIYIYMCENSARRNMQTLHPERRSGEIFLKTKNVLRNYFLSIFIQLPTFFSWNRVCLNKYFFSSLGTCFMWILCSFYVFMILILFASMFHAINIIQLHLFGVLRE